MNNYLIKSLVVIVLVIFGLGLVASFVYISSNMWGSYKNVLINQAYQRGKKDTVTQLIEQSDKCKPFSVYSSNKKIQLIKVSCIRQRNGESSSKSTKDGTVPSKSKK